MAFDQSGLHVGDEVVSVPSNAFASNCFDLIAHMNPEAFKFTGEFSA